MRKLKIISIVTGIITGIVLIWNFTAYRDIDMLKQKSPKFLEERGFKIVSYDGYEGDPFMGGFTWYQVVDENGFRYILAVGEWRGDLMIYSQKCFNAVSNK